MPGREPDRRVRRTKRRLKEALLELIEERDYDAITIRDITERADVGRSTFYSHYGSKEELLFSGFDQWLMSLAEPAPARQADGRAEGEAPAAFRFSLPLLRHIRSQRRFYQATIVRGSNAGIRRRTTALLVEPVGIELERLSRGTGPAVMAAVPGVPAAAPSAAPERLREAHVHGVVGAFLGLVSWWLDAADDLSAETVDQVFQRLVAERLPAR